MVLLTSKHHFSRAKFESLTDDLTESTLEPVRKALKDAKLSASDIDKSIISRWFNTYFKGSRIN